MTSQRSEENYLIPQNQPTCEVIIKNPCIFFHPSAPKKNFTNSTISVKENFHYFLL
jgi:hypothetical protein